MNPISVFTQFNLAACADAELAAYDIKGAFLLTPVADDKLIYLRIPPEVAEHWIRLYEWVPESSGPVTSRILTS